MGIEGGREADKWPAEARELARGAALIVEVLVEHAIRNGVAGRDGIAEGGERARAAWRPAGEVR